MRILGMNKTLEIRRTGVIIYATIAMGILSNEHSIRIVRIDIMGDDRSLAPTADPRGMRTVGDGRDLLVRSTAGKDTHRASVFTCALLADRYTIVTNSPGRILQPDLQVICTYQACWDVSAQGGGNVN